MFEERRQSSKLWEPGSFDVYKNAVVLMIAMLDCSKLDTDVMGCFGHEQFLFYFILTL